jgi:hypothetical protein
MLHRTLLALTAALSPLAVLALLPAVQTASAQQLANTWSASTLQPPADPYSAPPGSGVLPPPTGAIEHLPPPLEGDWAAGGSCFGDYCCEQEAQAFAYSDPLPFCYECCVDGCEPYLFHYGAKGRMYYLNDQRMEWTGQEATFGVEGVLAGGVKQQVGQWQCGIDTEFFLNQPFDRNILSDAPERIAFARNFDIDIFQISQLYASARKDDVYLAAGRFVTPFGRYYYPTYFNNFWDSPFVRSEVVAYRETGVLAQWDPGAMVFTAALTNGGPERDANSSKALVARIGVEQEQYAFGASVKTQDGIGSEHQKTFNNHFGLDGMVRSGRWTLSSEAVWDEYGLRRPDLALADIFWGRSYYYRELNNGLFVPLTGFGYYVDLGYAGDRWSFNINYGDYFPQQEMGLRAHDEAIHRGLFHVAYQPSAHWSLYGIALFEPTVPIPLADRTRKGTALAFGVQFTL